MIKPECILGQGPKKNIDQFADPCAGKLFFHAKHWDVRLIGHLNVLTILLFVFLIIIWIMTARWAGDEIMNNPAIKSHIYIRPRPPWIIMMVMMLMIHYICLYVTKKYHYMILRAFVMKVGLSDRWVNEQCSLSTPPIKLVLVCMQKAPPLPYGSFPINGSVLRRNHYNSSQTR